VRAVPRAWLELIAERWRGPLHLHVAEQPAEIHSCLEEHGLRPVELLDHVGLLGPATTLVHGIHLQPAEIERLGHRGVSVCACPSTERNLGDGVVPADALQRAGVSLCLGSDSQAEIDLLDEARQLEGHLRLLRLKRNVLASPSVNPSALGQRLLEVATVGGARSLGLPVGALEPGRPADFFTVDLEHPSLLGLPEPALLAGIVFGAPLGAIRDVAVQGTLIVRDHLHVRLTEPSGSFAAVVKSLAVN
jgi:formimidoylglutamate deiminase